ncbi:hypothetical protein Trihar35433_9082 [Trichoderma harzianum]|nr:hypothetical protein Trihar35433_9082 [Trichoderma harzianum]
MDLDLDSILALWNEKQSSEQRLQQSNLQQRFNNDYLQQGAYQQKFEGQKKPIDHRWPGCGSFSQAEEILSSSQTPWELRIAQILHEHDKLMKMVRSINGEQEERRQSKRAEDFSSSEKRFYVAGSINGTVVEALPDTGADTSFISPHLASRLGLHPVPGTQRRINLANKKTVKSPGMVKVPWQFSKETKTHAINCWVLPGCIRDLVLGNHFLQTTHTLTKFRDRIKSKLLRIPKQFSLSFLGNEKQRLRGFLNGHLATALPDTGSDAMFINGAYARKVGLDINYDIENRVQVRFADGSTTMTSGILRDADWKVGRMTVQCNFYILENLCVDVILSNNYLFEMNIFSEQEEHFFDINSEDDPEDDYEDYILYFCILSIDTKVHEP